MMIQRIAGVTRVLAKDQPEYRQLPISDRVVTLPGGEEVPVMFSLWEPTPSEAKRLTDGHFLCLEIAGVSHATQWVLNDAERELVKAGGSIIIGISGTVHPPILPYVNDPNEYLVSKDRAAMMGKHAVLYDVRPAPALEAVE